MVFLSLTTDTFLTEKNLISVLRQSSYIGIMAVGMVFVISMGDIDLSVGALLMFVLGDDVVLFRDGYSPIVAIVAGLALATFCGFCNGLLSVTLRIPTSSRRWARSVSFGDWAWWSREDRQCRSTAR